MKPYLFGAVSVCLAGHLVGCVPVQAKDTVQTHVVFAFTDADGKPFTAPDLIERADSLRDQAMVAIVGGAFLGIDDDLVRAGELYARALRLSPDSYDANLGLGVTYLTRAKLLQDSDNKRRSYLTASRRALGRAYMVRQGPLEPLYYLAEIAVLEKEYNKAAEFLKPLEDAGAKPGPVAALMGYIAERQSRKEEAQAYYTKALEAGGPIETIIYVTPKIKR